jgi:Ni/Co efflux regulator RcnB
VGTTLVGTTLVGTILVTTPEAMMAAGMTAVTIKAEEGRGRRLLARRSADDVTHGPTGGNVGFSSILVWKVRAWKKGQSLEDGGSHVRPFWLRGS